MTPYPERHLSFANMIEGIIASIIRDVRDATAPDAVGALSLSAQSDESSLEQQRELDVGHTLHEARQWEDQLIDRIDADISAKESVAQALVPKPPDHLNIRTVEIESGGRMVTCVDIREAAALLERSISTLRRYDKAGKIGFIRSEEGRRYLPFDDVEAARIVVRTTGEWANLLEVSDQTIRNWMKDIPSDLDPFELETRLKRRAANKGKHRRTSADEVDRSARSSRKTVSR